MKKRPFVPAKGVSNIELFYDLIFVYCISVMTSLCHHVHGDFLDFQTWFVFIFSYMVVLQVWFFTTLLINRYGDRSAPDNACLFINMFLLYFLANGIQTDWENSVVTFNMAWALILLNLIVNWTIKRLRYDNLDEDDRRIMNWNIATLLVQLAVVLAAASRRLETGIV